MKAWIFPSFAIVGAIGMGWTSSPVKEAVESKGKVEGLDAHENYASASLLGQFRTSFSSWLWLRTDLYLHNGVELRPLSELELKSGRQGVGTSDKEMNQLRNEDKVITIVPPPNHDFRGILGDIERQTSAYTDMKAHDHRDPVAALPLFRLMTWIDPKFIPAWTTGAVTIARDRSSVGAAKSIAFLNEGLKANPNNIDILSQIGFINIARKRDLREAVKHLEQARAQALAAETLTEDDKEALRTAYRWLGLCYRDLGEHAMLEQRMTEACKIFPDDKVLERLRINAPSKPAPVEANTPERHDHDGHDHHHDH
jgi:hypothetical protein